MSESLVQSLTPFRHSTEHGSIFNFELLWTKTLNVILTAFSASKAPLLTMLLNVDNCIATLQSGECVSEKELRQLCQYVSELLMEESNVQPVLSPVTIVGDLHGQFFDLINLLKVGGWPPGTSYIFLGDFVDRGHNSVETLSLLLCLKLKYPGHVTLLRGNHEVRKK
jgi:serine/threonine-protein phosphatase 6 catalytic subunit